jgi:hypothetical protein
MEFESKVAEQLDRDDQRIVALEEKIDRLQAALVVALRQSGIDLMKSLKFVESRVPTIDVPVVAEPVLTANQRLKPSRSGIIAPPAGGDGGSSQK